MVADRPTVDDPALTMPGSQICQLGACAGPVREALPVPGLPNVHPGVLHELLRPASPR